MLKFFVLEIRPPAWAQVAETSAFSAIFAGEPVPIRSVNVSRRERREVEGGGSFDVYFLDFSRISPERQEQLANLIADNFDERLEDVRAAFRQPGFELPLYVEHVLRAWVDIPQRNKPEFSDISAPQETETPAAQEGTP